MHDMMTVGSIERVAPETLVTNTQFDVCNNAAQIEVMQHDNAGM